MISRGPGEEDGGERKSEEKETHGYSYDRFRLRFRRMPGWLS